ncbi:MAG: SRPBCC family protein [Mycobacteriaceae bacterium]|nr:SRPBCC family protein [Mycobacteriaceae bacterium]MBV9639787.1 SRPBCC family protein [Mycobacteriaceae bacterium]
MSDRTFSFEINRTSRAPAATLFRLETDGGNWARWAKPIVAYSGWQRQGEPPPGGIGAVRKVGLWPVLVREQTVEYEQDRRHVYKLVGPPTPAKNYHGEVIFTPNATGGTDIRWSGSFTEGLRGTGPVMLAILRGAVQFFSRRLVSVAEREGATGRTV